MDGVEQSVRTCGYTTVVEPIDEMRFDDIAPAQLRMLDRGFGFSLPAGSLLCRNPSPLPACHGHLIDTRTCCAPSQAAGRR